MVKENTPEEIRLAMELLIHTATKYKAVVVGFVFSAADPAFISQFSNVKQGQFHGTLTEIMALAKVKDAQGLVLQNKIEKPA